MKFFTIKLSNYRNQSEINSQSSVIYSKQNENEAHPSVKENSVLYENVSGQLYMNQSNAPELYHPASFSP